MRKQSVKRGVWNIGGRRRRRKQAQKGVSFPGGVHIGIYHRSLAWCYYTTDFLKKIGERKYKSL